MRGYLLQWLRGGEDRIVVRSRGFEMRAFGDWWIAIVPRYPECQLTPWTCMVIFLFVLVIFSLGILCIKDQ